MKLKIRVAFRVLLALILIVFGSNKFLGFIPMEAPPEGSFMSALIQSGYMMPLVGFSQVAIGILLLSKKWKGFALVWLAPISINMVLFHFKYDISGIGPAALVLFLNVALIVLNWNRFRCLF